MNKRMRELMTLIEAKQIEAKSYCDGETKDLAKAASVLDEIDALKAEYAVLERVMSTEKAAIDVVEIEAEKKEAEKVDSVKAFATAARNRFKTLNEGAAVSGVSNGGYTVPEDILTRIEKYRDAKASLRDLVDVEKVNTLSGARTYKKRADQTGFSLVGEGSSLSAKNTPQFERLTYSIKKYGGIFPMTNEVLEDTDAALVQTLVEWIGDESRVTGNNLIWDVIEAEKTSPITIDSIDDIKHALNVTLGQAFKPTSVVVTNDSGLDILDQLKDETGSNKYLLGNPVNPMEMRLVAGATSVPLIVIPNSDLANDDTDGAPFIIGDLKEGIKWFDRKLMDIKVSDVATVGDISAFEDDMTFYRAIEREDVKIKDANAFVLGYWSLT